VVGVGPQLTDPGGAAHGGRQEVGPSASCVGLTGSASGQMMLLCVGEWEGTAGRQLVGVSVDERQRDGWRRGHVRGGVARIRVRIARGRWISARWTDSVLG
jgi:hypothetical protein